MLTTLHSEEDGSYLVRDSEYFPGQYDLSFKYRGRALHARIHCRNGHYFLTDQVYHISSHHITLHHTTSHYITSHHITSHHIRLHQYALRKSKEYVAHKDIPAAERCIIVCHSLRVLRHPMHLHVQTASNQCASAQYDKVPASLQPVLGKGTLVSVDHRTCMHSWST